MMFEIERPFAIMPFHLGGYRPLPTLYKPGSETEVEILGYATVPGFENWHREEGGGNFYHNLNFIGSLQGNGNIGLGIDQFVQGYFHAPEFWEEEIDRDHEKEHRKKYAGVITTVVIGPRWEDHIPFKGVTFNFKNIKKTTYKTEQEFEIIPPTTPYPIFGFPETFWRNGSAGEITEVEREETSEEINHTLPDDYEEGKHRFDSRADLSEEELIDRGYVHPGRGGGTFRDGEPKYGYDWSYEVREFNRYYFDDNPESTTYYRVLTKITTTYIEYDWSEIQDTVTPVAYYNRE